MNYLKTDLFKHQQQAFNKLKNLKACALFMDMGTGKTRTALELIQNKLNKGKITRVFWICPCSTKKNLISDINKHSIFSAAYIENIQDEFICVIGSETISKSDKYYLKLVNLIKQNTPSMLIIDESHMFKNPKAVRTERISKLSNQVSNRMILTGTPVTQGIWDLYSQFYFLHPKILGYNSFYAFAANHLEYSDKYPGQIINTHNTDYITKKINPYVYQITKKECLDLPPKTYSDAYFIFDDEQRKIYDQVKEYFINKISIDDFNGEYILNMLNYLHRIASGYIDLTVIDEAWSYSKGNYIKTTEFKFKNYDRAIETVEQLKLTPKGSKTIIWHKFNSDLELLQHVLDKEQIKYVYVNGKSKLKERDKAIEQFKTSKDINTLVVNINIGNLGLNLQEANYMIYYNSTFDYAKRIQSEDRIYRIGQNKNCHIIDILSFSGIDSMIEKSISGKSNLARKIRQQINEIKDDKEKIEEFKKKILNEF